MRILLLGVNSGTSAQRAGALSRLGHDVHLVDPLAFLPKPYPLAKVNWESGFLLCESLVREKVLESIGGRQFDLTWVDNGQSIGPSLIRELQRRFGPVLNFNVDDPYGKRDRFSWALYLKSVSSYDLIVVVRSENVPEAEARGAKKVLRVYRSADEVAHAPRALTSEDHARWDSEVVFVGTWFPERGPFMVELMRRGVPLTIYGDRWQKAKEWSAVQPAWKGPATKTNDEYAKAIQCAKVSLGLLSKGNRDLHTTRSLEVPSLGTVLCAERTPEHQYLYCEGEEAVFWSDAAECADACLKLLANDSLRREIARRGRERCLRNGTMNEQILSHVLSEALSS